MGAGEEFGEGVGGPADDAGWFVFVGGDGGGGGIFVCGLLICGFLVYYSGLAGIRQVPDEFIEAG